MVTIEQIFILSIPLLAIALTFLKSKGDKPNIRVIKFFGIAISSMPIIGVIQGLIAKNKSPQYSKACFTQAIYCGLGYVIVNQVLPNYI